MIAAAALTLRGVMEDRRRGRRDGRSLLDHRVYLVLVVVVGGGQRPNHLVNLSEFLHQVTVSTLEMRMGQRHTLSRLLTLLNFEGQPSSRRASSVPSFITSYKRSWHLTHLAHTLARHPSFSNSARKLRCSSTRIPRAAPSLCGPRPPSGRPTMRRPRKTPLAWSLSRSLARPPSRSLSVSPLSFYVFAANPDRRYPRPRRN